MMKKIIWTALILLLTTSIFAQKDYSTDFSVNLKSGVAIPLANFSKSVLETGSFADPGFYAGIDVVWMPFERIGFSVSSDLTMNPIRTGDLGAAKIIEDPFLTDLRVRSEPFKTISGYAGIVYKSKIFDRLNINSGVSFGIMYGETPYQLFKSQFFLVGPNYFEITASGSYAFSYKLNADIEYELQKQWSIFLHSAFLHAKHNFTFYQLSNNEERVEIKKIDILNIAIGIRLKI